MYAKKNVKDVLTAFRKIVGPETYIVQFFTCKRCIESVKKIIGPETRCAICNVLKKKTTSDDSSSKLSSPAEATTENSSSTEPSHLFSRYIQTRYVRDSPRSSEAICTAHETAIRVSSLTSQSPPPHLDANMLYGIWKRWPSTICPLRPNR